MGYGERTDQVVGALSRLLQVRAAKHNTVTDLEPYLDLDPDRLFPRPPPIEQMHVQRSLVDRATRSSTLSWQSSHEVLCDRYRRRHEREYRRNLVAWARWVRPERRQRRACLVYVHGWLEPGSWVEEATIFPKWGRALGVDLVHVALPFHGRRNPHRALFSGEYYWTADLVRTVEGVRQSICDLRAAVEWLRRQGYDQVGVSGISLGGALTMLLGCLEPMPDWIAPIVAHLQLVDAVEEAPILWRMKRDLDAWGIDRSRRSELFDRLGWASYRPKLAAERQLWVQAREDQYIDAGLVRQQWEAWSRPPILWIEGGHMTFPMHMDRITARIAEFRRTVPGG